MAGAQGGLVTEAIAAAFRRIYGARPESWFAPGRVNLIGEHTDYNLGFVCPIAIDLGCVAAAAPSGDGTLRVHSMNRNETREWSVETIGREEPTGGWSDYVLGVARQIPDLKPVNLLVSSDVPTGSGLSSSAALEVSSAMALGARETGVELAKLCRRAENEFVGMPCGIMDQYASVAGIEGAAVLIDCRSLEIRPVRLPEGISILAVNSMVQHELGATAYRTRVEECNAAAAEIGVASLREATIEQVERLCDPVIRRRARHIVTDNQRALDFAEACAEGDISDIGRIFAASHRSMREDYEITCEEIDFLVEAAEATPGVVASRMTGGGFGGCTVNLVRAGEEAEVERELKKRYQDHIGILCEIYRIRASAGARKEN